MIKIKLVAVPTTYNIALYLNIIQLKKYLFMLAKLGTHKGKFWDQTLADRANLLMIAGIF